MKISNHTVSVKAFLIAFAATVTAIVTIMTKGLTVWGAAGWETPNGHNADISQAATQILDFRNQWQCDELGEQLEELYADMPNEAGMARIERIKERMSDGEHGLGCARFED